MATVEPKITSLKTVDDCIRNAWVQYATDKNLMAAENSFREALALDSRSIDANYGLGLVMKSRGRSQDAVNAFEEAIKLISMGILEDRVRASMLRRLLVGHINVIKTGDWNLEKEIWQHKE